jgi:hypothetical protein
VGLLDVLKKKKTTLTPDEKLDRMWAMWANNELKLPCAKLMTYESEVNNGGHSQYFFNIANYGNLAAEVEAVLPMLPEPLRENLSRGYVAFAAQKHISDDDNDALFEECDDVFYDHEQLLIDILYEAAKSLTL